MKKIAAIVFGALLISPSVHALDVGVGLKTGTVGSGVEVSIALTDTVNARFSLTSIDVDDEEETFDVGDDDASGELDAELDLDFGATAILFDWYVFDGGFHLTAGFLRNDSELTLRSTLRGNITVDGDPLDSSDIDGGIDGDISLGESFQPYIGVGWGRKAGAGGGVSFTAEVGVAMLDPSADFDAEVDGGGSNSLTQAQLDDRLEGLEDDADDDLDDFELWPVLSIGVNYAF